MGYVEGSIPDIELKPKTRTEQLLPGLFSDSSAYEIYEKTLRESKVNPTDGFFGNLLAGFVQSTEDSIYQLNKRGLHFHEFETDDQEDAYYMALQQASTGAVGDTFFEQAGFTVGQMGSETGGTIAAGAGIGFLIGGPVGAAAGAGIGGLVGVGRMVLRAFDGGYHESINDQMIANQARLRRGEEVVDFDLFEANVRGASVAGVELALEKATLGIGKAAKAGKVARKGPLKTGKTTSLGAMDEALQTRGIRASALGLLKTTAGGALEEGSQELFAELTNMGVGQIQDELAGRSEDIDRFDPMLLVESFALGAFAGGTMAGGHAKLDRAIRNIQDSNNAKRIMPEVSSILNDAVDGTDLPMLGNFATKDATARTEDLTERQKQRQELMSQRDSVDSEVLAKQKIAGDKRRKVETRQEAEAEAAEFIKESQRLTVDINEQTRVLEKLELLDQQLQDGVKVRDMVDEDGNLQLAAGRLSAEQVMAKYGKKPRSDRDGAGDFTPAKLVSTKDQTADETDVAKKLKELGATSVRFYEGGEGSNIGTAPAFYSTESAGTLFIRRRPERRNSKTLSFAYGVHELIHMVQHLDPKLYSEIRELVGDLNVYKGARSYILDGGTTKGVVDQRAASILAEPVPLEIASAQDVAAAMKVESEGIAAAIEEGALAFEGPVSERIASLGILGAEAKVATKVVARLKAANTNKNTGIPGRAQFGGAEQNAAIQRSILEELLEEAAKAAATNPDSTPATPKDPGIQPARERTGYGKASTNVTVHDVRNLVPEGSRSGGSPMDITMGEPIRMASGNSFATFDEEDVGSIERVRATRIDYGVKLSQEDVDGLMSQAEDRLRERHGEDAVEEAKSAIALKVKSKPDAEFDIGSTRTGIRPDARGVMTDEEYRAAVAANPPLPEVAEKDNKPIKHGVTYSADGSFRTPNADFINLAINGSWAQRFWYEAFGQDLVRAFPFMEGARSLATVVSQFISATSPRTPVRDNLRRALGLIAAHMDGRPTNVSVMEPKGVLEAEAGEYGDAPGQFKVGSFNNTLALGMGTADTVPLPTLDVIMARFFGIPQEAFADPLVYELMSDFMGLLATEINGRVSQTTLASSAQAKLSRGEDLTPQDAMAIEPFRPWQLQAVMWSTRGDDTGTFSESLDEFMEQAYEAGLATKQNGVLTLTEEAFKDPRIEEILDEAAAIRGGARATVEVATEATAEGRRANNIGKYLLAKAVDTKSSEPTRMLARKLIAELYGPNNAFLSTLSASRRDVAPEALLDAAFKIDNGSLRIEAIVDPSGTGLLRGTINSNARSGLYKGGVKVGFGKNSQVVPVQLAGNQTIVQMAAGAELNRTVSPTMRMGAAVKSGTHLRTTSPGQVSLGTGFDGGSVVTGPLGMYPDTEGNLIQNNVVNVIVPGGDVGVAVQSVNLLSVSLAQEASASHRLTNVTEAPNGLGVTTLFVRGHQLTNIEIAEIQKRISNPNVSPLLQPVSNGTMVIFADFETFAETDQQVQEEIEAAVGAVIPNVQTVITTPAQGARLESDFKYVFKEAWKDLYPDGQTAPTDADITAREDALILQAAKDELDSGTFFDGIPAGEYGAEVFESDEAFDKRQDRLKKLQEKAERARDRAEAAYDKAIIKRNAAREAGKDTADLESALNEKRQARRLARQDAAKARDDYDNARPEPKRARKLGKDAREGILRVAPTRAEQLALIAPGPISRADTETGAGAKIVRKVYGRLAKLPADEQRRITRAVAGSQAFRLHHVRHVVQAHRADFRRQQQEANDSVAKRIAKDFPGKPQFARTRRPSVRVGELSVHVVPEDSEGFGNGVDVEQRSREHELMMRVNDNATKVLDSLISSGKVDDLDAHFGTGEVVLRTSPKIAHTLLINANDYGWSKIKKATTVGEALHIVAAMNPEDSIKARMNRLRQLAPALSDDIGVIEGAALRIVRSQGGRNEASKALANHLIDLGMDLDMPIDTQQRGSYMGVFVPPMRDTQADTAARQPRPAVGRKRMAQALMPNAVNGSLPDNWVEKGCLCIGPSGYFAPKAELYGAGAAYGVDAVGGVETLLHEVVHARTNLAIRDELARVLGGYESKTRMDMSSLDQRFVSQAGDARQASDESAAAVYLDKDPSDTVPWMRAICEAYLDALVYHRSPDFDKGGVGDYNVSNLDEFVAHAMTDRDTQDFLARVPSSLVAKDQQGLVPEMQSALQVQLSAIEELLRLPEDSLTTNHGSQLSVLEVAMSGAYRALKNQPQDAVAIREERAARMEVESDLAPLVFARERKPGSKQIPMRQADRERLQITNRLSKKRGAGAFATALQVIMDREKERLVSKKGTRPDIAALSGLRLGSEIQAVIERADKEAALREQMRVMNNRAADLKAKRVALEDAKAQTRKFIKENLDGADADKFTNRLMQAKTEDKLLKIEQQVVRFAARQSLKDKIKKFDKRLKTLLGRKMDVSTKQDIQEVLGRGREAGLRKSKLPQTAEEVSEYLQAIQTLDLLLVEAEGYYKSDRVAMKEAKDEQYAQIEANEASVRAALAERNERERDATGEVTTSRFGKAQRGGLDLQATLKLIGLDRAWKFLTADESRMLKARRDHMEALDAIVREAGFRDLADLRARASNTRGRINTEMYTITLGGVKYDVTLGQYLKLLAFDNETVDLIDKRRALSIRAGAKGSEVLAGASVDDIFAIRASAKPELVNMVERMKQARERDLRNPAMAALFRLTGNVPPMVAGYEPRSAEITSRIASLDEIQGKSQGNIAKTFAENAGFTKERRSPSRVILSDFASDYFDNMDRQLELAHLAEGVRVLWSSLTEAETRREITKRFGSEGYNKILQHVGYATRVLPAKSDNSLGWISTVVGGVLVMSPPTWGRILFGGLNTLQSEYSTGEVTKALAQVMGLVRSGKFSGTFAQQVSKKSGYLWDRDSSNAVDRRVVFSRDDGAAGIADIAQMHMIAGDIWRNIIASGQAAKSGNLGRASEHLNQARRALGGLPRAIPTLRLLDRIIVMTSVQAEMNKRGEQDASPESIQAAEASIRRTQNTSSPLDDSNITANLRAEGGYWQNLLAFTSDPMKTYSRLYDPGSKFLTKSTAQKVGIFVGGNAAINVGVTYLWEMLLASLIGDEDEKQEALAKLHEEKATNRALDMFVEEGIVRASPFPLLSFLVSRPVANVLAESLEAHLEDRDPDFGRQSEYLSDAVMPVGMGTAFSLGEGALKLYETKDPDRRAEVLEKMVVDGGLLLGLPINRLFPLLEAALTDASPAELRSAEYQMRKMMNISPDGKQFDKELKAVFSEARREGARKKKRRESSR
tara:strand:+ start:4839 stop:14729 length:9891 start_codon:yes stop_codon:yes gene_type:complete